MSRLVDIQRNSALANKHAYILDAFPKNMVVAGFTKPSLKGDAIKDMAMIFAFTGVNFDVAYMKQPHGAQVKTINGPGIYDCDGLFTKDSNLVLIVRTADCMPLIFYSEKESAVGVVHMGWRSAKEGILDNIGFSLSSFICFAGIGMRKCCYKVGKEFSGYRGIKGFIEERDGLNYFDPIGFIRENLIHKGLKSSNLLDYGVCSYCSDAAFHSHRRTGTTNRTLSFIAKTAR